MTHPTDPDEPATDELTALRARVSVLEDVLQRIETGHITWRGPDGQETHPDWCRECRVDAALAETETLRRTMIDAIQALGELAGQLHAASGRQWTLVDPEPPIGTKIHDALALGLQRYNDGWHPIGCNRAACRGMPWHRINFPVRPWQACARCRTAGVTRPGQPTIQGRFCDPCIDDCHDATDLGHTCPVCQAPAIVQAVTATRDGAGRDSTDEPQP